ncbi:MAG TPA: trypsin-like peptidase domain-containing protein, partial [Candidatus Binatia bacterium]|nr:trypsin-like peptidase domain-containing protein [Candidatus Binatia bacterium]
MSRTRAVPYAKKALLALLLLGLPVASVIAQQPAAPNAAKTAATGKIGEPKSAQDIPRPDQSESAAASLMQLNNALEGLAAKVSLGVVQVLVTGYGVHEESRTQTALIVRQQAVGSGVIVDSEGYIMTNAHVVEGAQRIRVALPLPVDSPRSIPIGKRRIVEARLLGTHKESDLALLKIDEKDLPALALLTQTRPRVGQLVFAIGSPEGLQNSVTMGVISAVSRQPDPTKAIAYIQTDAPINPGNSGGPLVDMNGAVLGINTFILSEGGGSEGLGFAIPARIVDFVYRSLRKYGHVHRVEIGAVAQEITPTMAAGLKLAQPWGVIIADVKPDGPAAAAGLQVQDIVLMADERRVETLPQLSSALYLHRIDELLKLEILRGEQKKTLYIPAIEHRDQMDQLFDTADPEKDLVPRIGVLATDLTKEVAAKVEDLRIRSGVIVLGRAADLITTDTGLQTGDIIHALNLIPITSMNDLRDAIGKLKTGDPVVLQVER